MQEHLEERAEGLKAGPEKGPLPQKWIPVPKTIIAAGIMCRVPAWGQVEVGRWGHVRIHRDRGDGWSLRECVGLGGMRDPWRPWGHVRAVGARGVCVDPQGSQGFVWATGHHRDPRGPWGHLGGAVGTCGAMGTCGGHRDPQEP